MRKLIKSCTFPEYTAACGGDNGVSNKSSRRGQKPRQKVQDKKIVLGIDPGLASTGWGVICEENKKPKLLDFGCISTPAHHPCGKRLQTITKELKKIIKKFKPQFVSIEDIFFAKNVKTAIKVGQAKGAILLTIENSNIPVKEYTPLQIKQAITGYGQADKLQIQIRPGTELPVKK